MLCFLSVLLGDELYVLAYGKYECFVMLMLYVCNLCVSCGSSQCCVLHDLQFVNAARGCKKRRHGGGILQSIVSLAMNYNYACAWNVGL